MKTIQSLILIFLIIGESGLRGKETNDSYTSIFDGKSLKNPNMLTKFTELLRLERCRGVQIVLYYASGIEHCKYASSLYDQR